MVLNNFVDEKLTSLKFASLNTKMVIMKILNLIII